VLNLKGDFCTANGEYLTFTQLNITIKTRSLIMNTVTLTDEYQLVIPTEFSKSIGLKAGTSFEIIPYNNRIELVPIKPIKLLKGIFKGIDTNIERDDDRL